ncbi:hypothetical protein [Maribacter hydrothermalis]|uniref:Uncharacterized protein n=1 Tax=Maribacter hydrothermalis TaxID=1836467 RepID=A0A1B7ZEQ5_9FLAO|nr:hypothetical protein [Maribacter hydrothermalis]APQ17539.1 hypothetical protein BTR34_09445 [Maribacter hydrothermalis]OBR42014.1 hypothetical protein A9200_01075 [Maribacter hydrothermalis]
MKYLIIIVTLISIGLIIYGFTLDEGQVETANKFIGSGTLGLFLLAMPLFLIKESKGKKLKDYMLTDDNVRKMQGKKPRNTDNQDNP